MVIVLDISLSLSLWTMAGSPRNLQPIVHAVINILFVLGQGSALARIWTRFAVMKNFWWDDWAMVLIVVRTLSRNQKLAHLEDAR